MLFIFSSLVEPVYGNIQHFLALHVRLIPSYVRILCPFTDYHIYCFFFVSGFQFDSSILVPFEISGLIFAFSFFSLYCLSSFIAHFSISRFNTDHLIVEPNSSNMNLSSDLGSFFSNQFNVANTITQANTFGIASALAFSLLIPR